MNLYEYSYDYDDGINWGRRVAYFVSKYPMKELDVMIFLYKEIYTNQDDEIDNIRLIDSWPLDDKKWAGITNEGVYFYE